MKIAAAALIVLLGAVAPALADKVDEEIAKAEEQFSKGKGEDALKRLTKLVEQNATSSKALVGLGLMQEKMGNLEEAKDSLGRAVQISASSPPAERAEALAALATLELRVASSRDALGHAQQAEQAQATPASLAVLARAEVRVHDARKALEDAERAVKANPSSAAGHEARGEALLALGRKKDAITALKKALELDPGLNVARIQLAVALVADSQAAEAVTVARKATEVDPNSGEAFAALGSALLAQNPQNWNDAIAQAQQGAFLNPKSPFVKVVVARIFEAAGNTDQAALAYRQALETDPGYVEARAAMAQAIIQGHVQKGDLEGALAEARKLAVELPQSADVQFQLGRVLLRMDNFSDAIEPLKKAVELAPGLSHAHALLGTAFQYTGQTPDAVTEYKKAVELDPDNVAFRTTYGLLLGVNDQHQEGIAELKRVIATPGHKDAAAYINLGWIYRNMEPKRPQESVAAYQKALEIDPKSAQAALGMGWAHSYAREWEKAIGAFQKAKQIDPKTEGEADNGIAWAYFFNKDMAKAREYMNKAKAAGRNVASLEDNLNRVEAMIQQNRDEADRMMREAEKQREREASVATINRDLVSSNPEARIRGVRNLTAALAGDAVPHLIHMAATDNDWDVRRAAVEALGDLGSAARRALRDLKNIRKLEHPLVQTKEQMEAEAKEDDYLRAVREAIRKIER
jgi:tetratricopeptide (TPR) repeat protein